MLLDTNGNISTKEVCFRKHVPTENKRTTHKYAYLLMFREMYAPFYFRQLHQNSPRHKMTSEASAFDWLTTWQALLRLVYVLSVGFTFPVNRACRVF